MGDHETVTIGETDYRRHATHYYEDGNFIFIVETTAFRLFQGILTRRSAVMKDMLGLPQPKQSDSMDEGNPQQLTLDGIPAVELQDDASEFALLLDFMFPRTCLSYPTVDWSRLLSLVQIAQKYGVDDVCTLASKRLAKILPTVSGGGQDLSVYKDPLTAVEVIESCRLSGLPAFLPLAFYSLSTMEWSDADAIESGALGRLSSRDQVRVHQGRASLQAEVMKRALFRWENSTGGGARQCGLCGRGMKGKLWSTQDDSVRWKELLMHPLEELDRRSQLQTLSHLCPDSCRRSFVAENGAFRKELLQSLGACFTLNDETTPFGGCP
ncbi:hypothetical protein M407DRAFT_225198 [Tulasnella calospora MUT 4182]|uniref:BTB domain-containing protein n=1 Tax=Tulasnella calospora MUT 4182 TaxID=1051891 RepID=A0A0C3KB38_9AGAM|nr:hypothetical protein M407DRAFT_225198 [Tulasnella calospora MUT 4182]